MKASLTPHNDRTINENFLILHLDIKRDQETSLANVDGKPSCSNICYLLFGTKRGVSNKNKLEIHFRPCFLSPVKKKIGWKNCQMKNSLIETHAYYADSCPCLCEVLRTQGLWQRSAFNYKTQQTFLKNIAFMKHTKLETRKCSSSCHPPQRTNFFFFFLAPQNQIYHNANIATPIRTCNFPTCCRCC